MLRWVSYMVAVLVICILGIQAHSEPYLNDYKEQPRIKERGLPPELKEKLTDAQIAELEAASTREEKKALLDSWGIAPPARPEGKGARRPRGPRPTRPDQESNASSGSSGAESSQGMQ